jgi:hypothetical protein
MKRAVKSYNCAEKNAIRKQNGRAKDARNLLRLAATAVEENAGVLLSGIAQLAVIILFRPTVSSAGKRFLRFFGLVNADGSHFRSPHQNSDSLVFRDGRGSAVCIRGPVVGSLSRAKRRRQRVGRAPRSAGSPPTRLGVCGSLTCSHHSRPSGSGESANSARSSAVSCVRR